jgi:hypothetical protein
VPLTDGCSLRRHLGPCGSTRPLGLAEGLRYWGRWRPWPPALAADKRWLRPQVAVSRARSLTPRRATQAPRLPWVWRARGVAWRGALVLGHPAPWLRGPRHGCRRGWRGQARPGRPPRPADPPALRRRMARAPPPGGPARLAHERRLTLGLRVSPRTGRPYLPRARAGGPMRGGSAQRWRTVGRQQAPAGVACAVGGGGTVPWRLRAVGVVRAQATRPGCGRPR